MIYPLLSILIHKQSQTSCLDMCNPLLRLHGLTWIETVWFETTEWLEIGKLYLIQIEPKKCGMVQHDQITENFPKSQET